MGATDPLGLAETLESRRVRSTIRRLTISPRSAVDFSSNDFLSLSSHPGLRKAFLNELQAQPAGGQLGSGGSRLLDGNSSYAERLEKEIAAFHNAPSGLLCNSGFDANVSVFSCLPQPNDVIVFDKLIHASVHDGMRLSRAHQRIPFAHNDHDALRSVLQNLNRNNRSVREGSGNVWIAVEAVYSMDGDVAPLKEINALRTSLLPKGNGHLIVDEAHATGLFGRRGRGLVCELGLEHQVAVRLHTFGKAFACGGAVLLCSALIREYLINYARPLIYSTFMSYPSLAAIKASYDFFSNGCAETIHRRLRDLIEFLHSQLLDLEATVGLPQHSAHLLRIPKSPSQSAISYIMSSKPKSLAAHCQDMGFVVRAIVAPTVPLGTERIRICLHANNTQEQVLGLMHTIRGWLIKGQSTHQPSKKTSKL